MKSDIHVGPYCDKDTSRNILEMAKNISEACNFNTIIQDILYVHLSDLIWTTLVNSIHVHVLLYNYIITNCYEHDEKRLELVTMTLWAILF